VEEKGGVGERRGEEGRGGDRGKGKAEEGLTPKYKSWLRV